MRLRSVRMMRVLVMCMLMRAVAVMFVSVTGVIVMVVVSVMMVVVVSVIEVRMSVRVVRMAGSRAGVQPPLCRPPALRK